MSSGCRTSFPNAQPALGYGLTETNAVGCAQLLGQLRGQAGLDRPRAEARSSSSRSSAPATRICRPANAARSAIRTAANIKCYWRNPEATEAAVHRRRLRPHRRRRLSRRGRLSVHRRPQEGHHHPRRREYLRGRGRGRMLRLPGSRRSGGVRRARRAAGRSAGRRHSRPAKAALSTKPSCARSSTADSPTFKIPGAVHLLGRAAAAARHGQDRPACAEGAVRALNA